MRAFVTASRLLGPLLCVVFSIGCVTARRSPFGTPPGNDPTEVVEERNITSYLERLAHSGEVGLDPEDFSYSKLRALRESRSTALDKALDTSFRSYVWALSRGRVDPGWLGKGWERSNSGPPIDSTALLRLFRSGAQIDYASLGPQHERFQRLVGALALHRRLLAEGVQSRLEPDRQGELARRIKQIELNLERWRWLPARLEPTYVEINIPSYELAVYDGGSVRLRMKVVVGKESWPSPILRSEITAIEVNPDWDVPHSIARQEILPAIRKDPGYLARHHMIVLDGSGKRVELRQGSSELPPGGSPYRFRQLPGPWGAMGPLKFLFASRYTVYLHGTPAQELFNKPSRPFSHGCIRIEDPLSLAELLLGEGPHSREWIQQEIKSGRSSLIRLPEPVPVYLNYWTAWVDEQSEIHFADDVYGGDAALERALDQWRHQRVDLHER